MKFALVEKMEMTQIWRNEIAVPVTKVKLEPGVVVQIKTAARDGYDAVVVGYGERKAKNIAKPQLGQMKGLGNFRYLKEFRYRLDLHPGERAEFEALARGAKIDPATFVAGDIVKVQGESKGKGFQGGVKRHRFAGHNTTHGTKDQVRMPGSIGAGEPQHVFRGTRMAGRMGGNFTTVANLEIIDIDPAAGVAFIKGALPGSRTTVLTVVGRGGLLTLAEEAKPAVVEEEAKAAAPAETEAPKAEEKAEAKPEEKKAEEKAEAKPEEKKEEPAAQAAKAEDKPEEKAAAPAAPKEEKKPAEKFEDAYVDKFAHLSKTEREKYSQPAVMEALAALEAEFKIDLVPAMTKVAVGEVKLADLAQYLANESKLETAKAEEIAKALSEKVFNLIGSSAPETSEK